MRHQYSGKKFGQGQDANEALTRKLLINFVRHGHITTTITKGKHLKAHVDRMIAQSKRGTQSAHNILLKTLGDAKLVDMLERSAAKAFAKRESGFTTHERLGRRMSDGTMMVRLSWTEAVVWEEKAKKPAKKAAPAAKEPAAKKAPAKKTVVKKEEK